MKTVTVQKPAAPIAATTTAQKKSLRKDAAAAALAEANAAAAKAKEDSAKLKASPFAALVQEEIAKEGKPAAKTATPGKSSMAAKKASKPAAKPAGKATKEGKAAAPKAAPKPAKEASKAKEKAAPVSATFTPRHMEKGKPVFVLDEITRPRTGRLLFAHTHAALTIMGLLDATRPAVPKSQVLTIMGQRAVSYHLKQTNFETGPNNTIRLSVLGYNSFKDRAREGKFDLSAASAFQSMFLDGIPAPALHVTKDKLYQATFG